MQNEESKAPADTVKGRYMGSVKVGTKGQIVIPKEARDIFNIKPGDTLLLLADIERGIAIHGLDFFNKMADEILAESINQRKMKRMKVRFSSQMKSRRLARRRRKRNDCHKNHRPGKKV